MHLASSRRPAMAIQLYSAIHYTAIQRYTVYMLYIIPLGRPLDLDVSDACIHNGTRHVQASCARGLAAGPRHQAVRSLSVSVFLRAAGRSLFQVSVFLRAAGRRLFQAFPKVSGHFACLKRDQYTNLKTGSHFRFLECKSGKSFEKG